MTLLWAVVVHVDESETLESRRSTLVSPIGLADAGCFCHCADAMHMVEMLTVSLNAPCVMS